MLLSYYVPHTMIGSAMMPNNNSIKRSTLIMPRPERLLAQRPIEK
ncbi:hypothetical protein SF2A35B_2999 [Lactiplantibacillus plantarum]|nr:hypothetical protein SF2A35B_2999 [Lactiplantibacillus plantarum]